MKQTNGFLRILFFMMILSAGGAIPLCAQNREVQPEANPASDFAYDLNETEDGVVITGYRGSNSTVVIPAEIEDFPVVEWNVKFYGDSDIATLIFPDSITKIVNPEVDVPEYRYGRDEYPKAFSFLTSLKKVKLPKYLKEIPEALFSGCKTLTNIQLPDKLEIIGYKAFSETSIRALVLPSNLKIIDAGAFWGCSNLETLTLPDSVEYIGAAAFSGTSIKTLIIPKSVKKIGKAAFYGCSHLNTLTLFDGLESIGSEAFKYTAIKKLIIPQSMKEIEESAFSDCAVETVTIPQSVKSIGKMAFYNCKALATVTLSTGLESIGAEAFQYTAIKTLTIPSSIKKIKEGAFSNCESLETLVISDGIEFMGAGSFQNCINLTNVTLPVKQIEYKSSRRYYEDGSYDIYCFSNCPRISLKDRKKIKETGYTGTFN